MADSSAESFTTQTPSSRVDNTSLDKKAGFYAGTTAIVLEVIKAKNPDAKAQDFNEVVVQGRTMKISFYPMKSISAQDMTELQKNLEGLDPDVRVEPSDMSVLELRVSVDMIKGISIGAERNRKSKKANSSSSSSSSSLFSKKPIGLCDLLFLVVVLTACLGALLYFTIPFAQKVDFIKTYIPGSIPLFEKIAEKLSKMSNNSSAVLLQPPPAADITKETVKTQDVQVEGEEVMKPTNDPTK